MTGKELDDLAVHISLGGRDYDVGRLTPDDAVQRAASACTFMSFLVAGRPREQAIYYANGVLRQVRHALGHTD